MDKYIYKALSFFRVIFSRSATWVVFCMVILGFIGAADMIGVSSFCRFRGDGEKMYHVFLHFFSCILLVYAGTSCALGIFCCVSGCNYQVSGSCCYTWRPHLCTKRWTPNAWSAVASPEL